MVPRILYAPHAQRNFIQVTHNFSFLFDFLYNHYSILIVFTCYLNPLMEILIILPEKIYNYKEVFYSNNNNKNYNVLATQQIFQICLPKFIWFCLNIV